MNAAAQALEKQAAERTERWPATLDCIAGLYEISKTLASYGWRFDVPPGPGQYDVICFGFPGQYTAEWAHCVGGFGWIVRDTHGLNPGEPIAWRSKDWPNG